MRPVWAWKSSEYTTGTTDKIIAPAGFPALRLGSTGQMLQQFRQVCLGEGSEDGWFGLP